MIHPTAVWLGKKSQTAGGKKYNWSVFLRPVVVQDELAGSLGMKVIIQLPTNTRTHTQA